MDMITYINQLKPGDVITVKDMTEAGVRFDIGRLNGLSKVKHDPVVRKIQSGRTHRIAKWQKV